MSYMESRQKLADTAASVCARTTPAGYNSWALSIAAITVALFTLGAESCENNTPQTGIVGNTTCTACHDGRSASNQLEFLASPHAQYNCETCHGPGITHVREGGRHGLFIDNPGKGPFEALHESCQSCHADKGLPHDPQVMGYLDTIHYESGAVTCIDCHNVHKQGAMAISSPTAAQFSNDSYAQLCGKCHEIQVEQHLDSVHAASDVATCGSCHNMHREDMFTQSPVDNQLCLQCHSGFNLGFISDAEVDFHTGDFHPVDPAGNGASRCTECHLPPVAQGDRSEVPHDHTLFTVPPIASNEAGDMGIFSVPPNSCAGIQGCHDAAVPGSGMPYDVNIPAHNEALQPLYEAIGELP